MPHIVGETVYLREYRMEDLASIHAWRNLGEITFWTAVYVWPDSPEQTRRFLEDQVNNVDPANRKFAICLKEDDRYLGHIGYEHLDLRQRHTEVGIVIGDPAMLSRGIGTEALDLFLRVCFDELDLHRVGLRVLRSNERAIRCYEKCGFAEEGALREWHHAGGKWHDMVLMGILADEYRARHGATDPHIAS
jgi:RimJ/RimL family protein N-acetyltransferase